MSNFYSWPFMMRHKAAQVLVLAFAAAFALLSSQPLFAQSASNMNTQTDSGAMQISADDGITWNREQRSYVAQGNALAQNQEGLSLEADNLSAFYGIRDDKSRKIELIRAKGKVIAADIDSKLRADSLDMDLNERVTIARGRLVQLDLQPALKISTTKSIILYQNQNRALLEGKVLVVDPQFRLAADIMEVIFSGDQEQNADQNQSNGSGFSSQSLGDPLEAVAEGNIIFTANTSTVTAKALRYDFKRRLAQFFGAVQINQEGNQISGEYAEYYLDEGMARITSRLPHVNDASAQDATQESPRVFGFIQDQGQ